MPVKGWEWQRAICGVRQLWGLTATWLEPRMRQLAALYREIFKTPCRFAAGKTVPCNETVISCSNMPPGGGTSLLLVLFSSVKPRFLADLDGYD